MSSVVYFRLQRFVDREAEIRTFKQLLDEKVAQRPVTVIWGDGGIGKSTLLDWIDQQCATRGIIRSRVVWSETRNHDYLGVMREISEDLAAARFAQFNELMKFFFVPQYRVELALNAAGVVVGQNMQVSGTVGNVIGINLDNVNLSLPRQDLGISESDRMVRLTDIFLRELNTACGGQPTVLLLDAFEKASAVTRAWICNELVGARLDGRLDNVLVVICGRVRPELQEELWVLVNEMHLAPLERGHVIQYMEKSALNIAPGSRADVADMLLASTEGVPGRLAGVVQAFAKQRSQRAA